MNRKILCARWAHWCFSGRDFWPEAGDPDSFPVEMPAAGMPQRRGRQGMARAENAKGVNNDYQSQLERNVRGQVS
jgi:hypothetical protein